MSLLDMKYKGKTLFPKLFTITRYERVSEKLFTGSFAYNSLTPIYELVKQTNKTVHEIEHSLERDEKMLPLRRKD